MNELQFISYVMGKLKIIRNHGNKYQLPYLLDNLIEEISDYIEEANDA